MNVPRDRESGNPSQLPTLCLWAIIVGGSAIWLQQGHLRVDVDAYREMAQNLCETHTFARTLPSGERCPTAYRPPLYPTLLAIAGGLRNVTPFHVAILHLAFGVAITVLTFQVARYYNERVAWLAALAVPLDPLLLRWSTYPMTESAATLLFLVLLHVGLRWYNAYQHSAGVYTGAVRAHRPAARSILHMAGMWGAAFGLATLCRPVFVAWAVLVAAGIGWLRPRHRMVTAAAALLLGTAIVLLPWTFRNARLVGVPTPFTTHGGYTLLLSNNPLYYRHLREHGWREPWDARELQDWLAEINVIVPQRCQPFEGDYDRSCRRLAIESIRNEPGMFLYASVVRVANLWSPLPHATDAHESTPGRAARYTVAVWYVGLFCAALCGLRLARRRVPFLLQLGFLACLAFTCVHAVYFSNMRMRTLLMPWWTILAAVQLDQWLAALLKEQPSPDWGS